MSRPVAVIKDGKLLKWCYNCHSYQWAEVKGNQYICARCNQVIENWVSRLLYRRN